MFAVSHRSIYHSQIATYNIQTPSHVQKVNKTEAELKKATWFFIDLSELSGIRMKILNKRSYTIPCIFWWKNGRNLFLQKDKDINNITYMKGSYVWEAYFVLLLSDTLSTWRRNRRILRSLIWIAYALHYLVNTLQFKIGYKIPWKEFFGCFSYTRYRKWVWEANIVILRMKTAYFISQGKSIKKEPRIRSA